MIYLVDTNILLRVADRRNTQHEIARTAVRKLKQDQHQLQVVAQNCVEFCNVMTRPLEKNGLGLTPIEADRLLCLIERLFPVYSAPPNLYSEWRRLVVTFQVSGVQVHDARLVAAMKALGLTHILTFNTKDFIRYAREGIVPIHPATV